MQANNFQLQSTGLKVSYSASGIDGKPSLQYQQGANKLNFHGDQIRIAENEIGTLVSVTLKYNPDLNSIVFTLILPTVNVSNQSPKANVTLKALETTIKTSIAGPALVKGQVQSSKAYTLKGTASAVEF